MCLNLLSVLIFFIFLTNESYAGIFYPLNLLNPPKRKIEVKKKMPKFKLEGIVKGEEPVAIINGIFLKRGDSIEGCLVSEINIYKNYVTLLCKGVNVKLKINLLESEDTLNGKGEP